MFLYEAISIIKEMYLKGGIEISTKSDSFIYAWTLIQPDGDIINKVSDKAIANPDVWRQHLKKVNQNITILRKFRRFMKWVSAFPILALLGYYAVRTAIEKGGLGMRRFAIMGLLLSLFIFVSRPIASSLLRWYIGRGMGKA